MADDVFVDWVEIYEAEDGDFYWRAKSNNGKTVADGGGFNDESGAVKSVAKLFPNKPLKYLREMAED